MTTYLDKIVSEKKLFLEKIKKEISLEELMDASLEMPVCRNLKEALSQKTPSIIAEIKFHSPSKGILLPYSPPAEIGIEYEKNGAAAISVLTDTPFFGGENIFLTQVKKNVSIPVLRKDFIIDPWQIYESKKIGADAILLIVAALGETQLSEFLYLADSLGLSVLTEVHTIKEANSATKVGAKIIGINNRDLLTFTTNIETSISIRKSIPENKIVVSESGINSYVDIQRLMAKAISSFLIGESIITSPNKGAKIQELLGK